MKKITMIISAATLLLAVGVANPLKAQTEQKETYQPKPVPAEVKSIVERSCIACHSEDGNALAKMKFNFTKWDEYSTEKQVSTGQDMCKMLTKGKMPPQKYLDANPEAKPSDKEKKIICDWAATLSGIK